MVMRLKSVVAGLLASFLIVSQCAGAVWTISTPANPTSYPRGTTQVVGFGSCSVGGAGADIVIVDSLGTPVSTKVGITSVSLGGTSIYWAGTVQAVGGGAFVPTLNCTYEVLEGITVKATSTVHFL